MLLAPSVRDGIMYGALALPVLGLASFGGESRYWLTWRSASR